MSTTLDTLKTIAQWAGNLPDESLTNRTGPNDAALRGGMVTAMRALALEEIRKCEPGWNLFDKPRRIIAYVVQEDCTLDSTRYEYEEVIEVPWDDVDNNWKGLDFFNSHPVIFKPVYEGEEIPTSL